MFNIDGELYAIEDVCTHDGGELAGGPIEGYEIECLRHGAKFDLRTGAALSAPGLHADHGFPGAARGRRGLDPGRPRPLRRIGGKA